MLEILTKERKLEFAEVDHSDFRTGGASGIGSL